MKALADNCHLKHNTCWRTWMVMGGIKLTCPCEAYTWKNGTFFLVLVQWNIIGLLCCIRFSFSANHCPHSSVVYCDLHYSPFLWLILTLCKSTPVDSGDKSPQQNTTQRINSQSRPLRRSNCPWMTLLPIHLSSATGTEALSAYSFGLSVSRAWGYLVRTL